MDIPFTTESFLGVFREYNLSMWPAQIAALLVATLVIALALRGPDASRGASALLAALWLWMGIVYHAVFFAPVNPAAYGFAALFVIEALLILRAGSLRGSLRLHPRGDLGGALGGVAIAYALVIYPLLGAVSSHPWPASPTFGLPCPTTIFTLGLLMWAERPMPRHLLVIPVLWSIIATVAALRLGIPEDLGLPLTAALALVVLLRKPVTTPRALAPH